jgi:putative ABC transport system ATP-binding protein
MSGVPMREDMPGGAATTDALAIDARAITKTYGEGALAYRALRGVDFHVARGEFVMLAGPSGSGKTTLLSILGCVLGATSGDLSLFGRRVSGLAESRLPALRIDLIGFIFQGHNLLASLEARENVALPLQLRGVPVARSLREADELLARVGLSDKTRSRPAELSGGQRQRVSIARALAGNPPLVLADEPTAALDAQSGQLVTELLREVCRERGDTVVVVTHDARIFHLADRIVHIEDGLIAGSEPPPDAPRAHSRESHA